MSGKIPHDALQHYLGLGPERSYQKVADHYGVSKRAVTKLAARESWQDKVIEFERKARAGAEKKALESLEGMNLRPHAPRALTYTGPPPSPPPGRSMRGFNSGRRPAPRSWAAPAEGLLHALCGECSRRRSG